MRSHGVERLRHDLRGGSVAWDAAFNVEAGDPTFAHMTDMVTAKPSDIFTAKLSNTRQFFNAVKSGQVSVLCPAHLVPDYASTIDLLTVIVTHNLLARTGVAEMRSPGFWIPTLGVGSPGQGFCCDPVMPVSHLTTITGFSETQLMICLSALVRDDAVRFVKNKDGVLGVVLIEGVCDSTRARRFMRR